MRNYFFKTGRRLKFLFKHSVGQSFDCFLDYLVTTPALMFKILCHTLVVVIFVVFGVGLIANVIKITGLLLKWVRIW